MRDLDEANFREVREVKGPALLNEGVMMVLTQIMEGGRVTGVVVPS